MGRIEMRRNFGAFENERSGYDYLACGHVEAGEHFDKKRRRNICIPRFCRMFSGCLSREQLREYLNSSVDVPKCSAVVSSKVPSDQPKSTTDRDDAPQN